MTRRILTAIVAVTAVAVMLFGVPLGVGVYRLYRNEAILRLEREAARAAVEVPASFAAGDPAELRTPAAHTRLALYGRDGRRVLGAGPDEPDRAVRAALAGQVVDTTDRGDLVVAVPLTSNEIVFGAVRAATSEDRVRDRAERTWLAMGGLAAGIIVLAAVAARVQARRLARPLATLTDAARRLGNGDFSVRAATVGVAELDDAADALNATAERIGQLVTRERAFSADASHQLRTPLTAARVRLESTLASPSKDRDEAVREALGDIDRLEETVESLLALARDTEPNDAGIDLVAVLADVEARWHGILAAAGRPLRMDLDVSAGDARGSASAVRQILDVLVDNALRHGAGTVTITARELPGAVAIDVGDEGPGPDRPQEQLFERRSPDATGRGIGLALARSLAEAEGGRLVFAASELGPTFTLVLRAGQGTDAER